jgi:hypothetical protein
MLFQAPPALWALTLLGCALPSPSVPAQAPASEKSTLRFGDAARELSEEPFFPGAAHDPAIPHPDQLLPQPLGSFTAHHHEILAALRAMAKNNPRMREESFGRTHEGRELVLFVISTPANLQRLDSILADLGKLADPRGVADSELERIVQQSPAVAWLGHSIHGDEMSGSDSALATAWHFAAGTGADVMALLEQTVIVIDPCQNPDGRERILSQLVQGAGYVPNLDPDAMQRGRWPYGRGNHFLFDMNRDWLWGTQPETRARWAAIRKYKPQLLVDAHEMGGLDTYLFYPATDPFTPHFPLQTLKWWPIFAADQGAAFDRYGWSYYTREWADSWYPGYTDSWGSYQGAVGILYEQARFHGQALRRASGEIATYREAVHHQTVSAVANTTTLFRNREALLRGYLETRQRALSKDAPGVERSFVLVPGRHPSRERELIERLLAQGLEVWRTQEEVRAQHVDTLLDGRQESRAFPKGALVIHARQPLGSMALDFLSFDPRYDQGSLDRERKELERKQQSKVYDVTGWSPAHAYDLEAYWAQLGEAKTERFTGFEPTDGRVSPLTSAELAVYGWAVDGQDDGAVRFAVEAMELGLKVAIAEEPFAIWSAASASSQAAPIARLARGSLLVRRHENGADVSARVEQAARRSQVVAHAAGTARSMDSGPDLGGGRFALLARPRVGILSNAPVSVEPYGHTWHLIDTRLGLPCSQVNAAELSGYDLRKYNVLVIPEAGGGLQTLLKEHAEELNAWVKGGGTLIASGSSAAQLVASQNGLTKVLERREALKELPRFREAVQRERAAGRQPVDAALVFGDKATESAATEEPKPAMSEEQLARWDEWAEVFAPRGAILRAESSEDHWLTYGCGRELPVYYEGASALLSSLPIRTPVRLAPKERLRLSGLVWPEARERLGDAAYCTVESVGNGQVILFASAPEFRGWFRGTMRLLSNAIVYGPGLGARQPNEW